MSDVDLIPEQWRNRLYPRFENNAGQLPPIVLDTPYIYFLLHWFFAAPSGSPLRISKKQALGANEKPYSAIESPSSISQSTAVERKQCAGFDKVDKTKNKCCWFSKASWFFPL
jgi:hypothetical protein